MNEAGYPNKRYELTVNILRSKRRELWMKKNVSLMCITTKWNWRARYRNSKMFGSNLIFFRLLLTRLDSVNVIWLVTSLERHMMTSSKLHSTGITRKAEEKVDRPSRWNIAAKIANVRYTWNVIKTLAMNGSYRKEFIEALSFC